MRPPLLTPCHRGRGHGGARRPGPALQCDRRGSHGTSPPGTLAGCSARGRACLGPPAAVQPSALPYPLSPSLDLTVPFITQRTLWKRKRKRKRKALRGNSSWARQQVGWPGTKSMGRTVTFGAEQVGWLRNKSKSVGCEISRLAAQQIENPVLKKKKKRPPILSASAAPPLLAAPVQLQRDRRCGHINGHQVVVVARKGRLGAADFHKAALCLCDRKRGLLEVVAGKHVGQGGLFGHQHDDRRHEVLRI